MNEHTTINPTTGIDEAHVARIEKNVEFWAKVDAMRKVPRKGWDTVRPGAPITRS